MPQYEKFDIITRKEKGFPLTVAELDNNFTNLGNFVSSYFETAAKLTAVEAPSMQIFWNDLEDKQWKMQTKIKELPDGEAVIGETTIVGLFIIEGTGTVPDDNLDYGSGIGSLCYNTVDNLLWIRVPSSS